MNSFYVFQWREGSMCTTLKDGTYKYKDDNGRTCEYLHLGIANINTEYTRFKLELIYDS